MNILIELPEEEIDQAINDAEQLQASVKATMTKLVNYLRRLKSQQQQRKFIETNPDLLVYYDKQTNNIADKILDSFNRFQREFDKQLRDFKEQVPTKPTTIILSDENETLRNNQILRKEDSMRKEDCTKRNVQKQLQIQQQQQQQQDRQTTQKNTPDDSKIRHSHTTNQAQKKLYPIFNIKPKKTHQRKQQEVGQPKAFTYGRLKKFEYFPLNYISVEEGYCDFCKQPSDFDGIGKLMKIRSCESDNIYKMHEMCALWSQNLVFHNKKGCNIDPKNIDEEYESAQKKKCSICNQVGANLRCAECEQAYHFLCFMRSDEGSVIPEQFKILCDEHQQQLTSKAVNRIKKQIKKKKKQTPSFGNSSTPDKDKSGQSKRKKSQQQVDINLSQEPNQQEQQIIAQQQQVDPQMIDGCKVEN